MKIMLGFAGSLTVHRKVAEENEGRFFISKLQ